MSEYQEAALTVMTYFGALILLGIAIGAGYLFQKANRILNKADKFIGYVNEQEEEVRKYHE